MTIDEAFQKIDRADFLPDDVKDQAHIDAPIPIGFGQTNSQPTTVRLMLEWLQPRSGDKILDVGSGSGWTTALLASLVGSRGQVFGVERVPELAEFGADNARRAGIKRVNFFVAGRAFGLPQYAPYDRILVGAAASELPMGLINQLKVGGRLVIPVNGSIEVIDKTSANDFEQVRHPGFAFVPLMPIY